MIGIRAIIAFVFAGLTFYAGAQSLTETSFERGWEIVARSHDALGGETAARAAGQLVVEAEGFLDRGARHQGMTPSSSNRGSYAEWIVIDEENERVGFQQVHERYDGAVEHWRFVYANEDLMRISDPVERFSVEIREPMAGEKRRRIARLIPQVLIDEALNRPSSLRWLGLSELEGERVDFVSWSIDDQAVTLIVDHDTGVLRGVEAMVDETLVGDTAVRWIYGQYENVEGLGPFPAGYRIEIGGRVIKRVSFSRVRMTGASDHAVFGIPEGLPKPKTPPPASGEEMPPAARVIERAPWIWQVAGIRSGFNVAFFELEDSVVVFEAPAGWLEVHEIPPSNFSSGATSSSVSEELIRLVRETVPDKPIRYVVLSHFHGDHAGGVRAFMRAGATIVTTPEAIDVLSTAARNAFRVGVEGPPVNLEPRFEIVEDSLTLGEGERTVEIVEIAPNPHVEGMLAIWVPSEESLFVADLFHAQRLEFYPSPTELELQKSFIRWLDRSQIDPERIYGVHGGVGTPAHLQKLREAARQ